MLINILTLMFMFFIEYAIIYNWKFGQIKPWMCIPAYAISLSIALLKGADAKQIFMNSSIIMLVILTVIITILKLTDDKYKEYKIFKDGETLMIPAISLFTFDKDSILISFAFLLTFLITKRIKNKGNMENSFFIIPLFASCLVYVFI